MDKISSAHQDTNKRIVTVIDDYPEEVASNAAFATGATRFRIVVADIDELSVAAGIIPDVTATEKNTARDTLEDTCLTIGKPMAVYGKLVKDVSLQDFLKLVPSQLRRMRSTDFLIYSQSLMHYVTKYTAELGTVGISEALQTEMTVNTENYSSLLESPKEKINRHKVILASRKEKIDETIDIINNIFNLLISTYDSESAFVLDYMAASQVVDPATIHRKEDEEVDEVE